MSAELDIERANLAKAEQDIADGERRVSEQTIRIGKLDRDGHGTAKAWALLQTLRESLAERNAHRDAILKRIEYLESKPGQ